MWLVGIEEQNCISRCVICWEKKLFFTLYHWFLEREKTALSSWIRVVLTEGICTAILVFQSGCRSSLQYSLIVSATILMTVSGFQCSISPCWSDHKSFYWLWVRIKALVTGTEKNKCLSDPSTNGFLWHSNVWVKRNKKIEADGKKRTFILFLKHLSKQIMSFTTLVWKRLLKFFWSREAVPFSEPECHFSRVS